MKHLWNCKIDALPLDRPRTWIVFKLLILALNKLAWDDAAALEFSEVKLGKDVKSDRNRMIRLVCNWRRSFYRIGSKWHFSKSNNRRRDSNWDFVDCSCYVDFNRIQIADVYDNAVLKKP